MGLWNFVKNAGKKLGSRDDAADAPDKDALIAEIEALGLEVTGLDVSVDGDKVNVKGKAVSQEAKEKVILAVGNVKGVATVEDYVEGVDPVFHTVEKGDTLSAIARKTLGNANRYPEIAIRIDAEQLGASSH